MTGVMRPRITCSRSSGDGRWISIMVRGMHTLNPTAPGRSVKESLLLLPIKQDVECVFVVSHSSVIESCPTRAVTMVRITRALQQLQANGLVAVRGSPMQWCPPWISRCSWPHGSKASRRTMTLHVGFAMQDVLVFERVRTVRATNVTATMRRV